MDKADNTAPKYGDENMGFAFLPKTIFSKKSRSLRDGFCI